ncbi:transferase [bacterium]|jgi:putative transferase (TIGR04331 family)|nr:transferase [bacterium]
MVARTLITTADERTWPEDKKQPIIFLGEWCKRYTRKFAWQQLNAEVEPYHWDDRNKLYKDYQYIDGLYEELIIELSEKLNQIHSADHSIRYWRIIIGPWLGYFLQTLFDRWVMLKQVIEKSKPVDCYLLERDSMSIVSNDMSHFLKLFVNDDWNEAVYGQLLELFWKDKINIKRVRLKAGCLVENYYVDKKTNVTSKVKKSIKKLILKFNIFFSKSNENFFIISYLPKIVEFKLQIRLGQFPKIWSIPETPRIRFNIEQRQWRLRKKKYGSFEDAASNLISQHIPIAYLEGYSKLFTAASQLPWPKEPKSIFTSNAHMSNDLFKVWAASKVELGSPLIIGQHGGNYGMGVFSFSEDHEITIADKWLSWGWSYNKTNVTPVGNLKIFDERVSCDPNGGALMVEMAVPRYSYHLYSVPVSSQWLDYFEDQKTFLKCLPLTIQKQVTLRFKEDYGWDQIERWKSQDLDIKIDFSGKKMRELISKSRIFISTYNATTYLESLSWNVPTIIFWNPDYWEMNKETEQYFELLSKVGIFHKTPEGAAQHMSHVWNNVSEWWESNEVQNARNKFNKQFSNVDNHVMDRLEEVFHKVN